MCVRERSEEPESLRWRQKRREQRWTAEQRDIYMKEKLQREAGGLIMWFIIYPSAAAACSRILPDTLAPSISYCWAILCPLMEGTGAFVFRHCELETICLCVSLRNTNVSTQQGKKRKHSRGGMETVWLCVRGPKQREQCGASRQCTINSQITARISSAEERETGSCYGGDL